MTTANARTQPTARTQTRADDNEPRWSDFDAHLTPEKLDGKAHTAQILRWAVVDVFDQKERKSIAKPAIYLSIFTDQFLILSPTNRKRLMAAFGDRRAGCVGKLITIKAEKVRVGQRDLTPIRITIPAQVDTTTGEIVDSASGQNAPLPEPPLPAKAAATQSPQPPLSAPIQRPFSAEQLRTYIKAKVAAVNEPGAPEDKLVGATLAVLTTLVRKNEINRHALTAYLIGKSSLKEATAGELRVLKSWVAVTQDAETKEWVPSPFAITESERALTAYWVEQGPQEPALSQPTNLTGDPLLDYWDKKAAPTPTGGK